MQQQRPWRRLWYAMLKSISSTRVAARLYARILPTLDRAMLRITGNRHSLTGLLAGLPVVTLTTIGARSGKLRTTPLLAIEEGNRVILFATNFGQSRHPAWYHNLRAHPDVMLTIRGRTESYFARDATETEREKYWPAALDLYAGYAAYEERAQGRSIPIIILTRKKG